MVRDECWVRKAGRRAGVTATSGCNLEREREPILGTSPAQPTQSLTELALHLEIDPLCVMGVLDAARKSVNDLCKNVSWVWAAGLIRSCSRNPYTYRRSTLAPGAAPPCPSLAISRVQKAGSGRRSSQQNAPESRVGCVWGVQCLFSHSCLTVCCVRLPARC